MPPLIVSTCFTDSSYTIHLTDVCHTWSESLNRKAIIMRGFQEDTVIDPSDGENMRALLDILKDAFDSSSPSHARVTLSLASYDRKQTGGEGLLLTVKHTFPEETGLAPLVWPVYLKKCPQSTTISELVLPLIHDHYVQSQQIDALARALRNKDAALRRMQDKMENRDFDREPVLNSLQPTKVSREVAEARIKRRVPFNFSEWAAKFTASVEPPDDIETLIQRVFGGTGVHYRPRTVANLRESLVPWWTAIGNVTVLTAQYGSALKPDVNISSLPTMPAADDDEDDFQVQETPPHLVKRHAEPRASKPTFTSSTEKYEHSEHQVQVKTPLLKTGRSVKLQRGQGAILGGDSSTEDEMSTPSSPSTRCQTRAGKTRMGVIGRKAKSKSPEALYPPCVTRSIGGNESESASDRELDCHAIDKEPSPTRAGRGGIDSTVKKASMDLSQHPEEGSVDASFKLKPGGSQAQPAIQPRRIGMIGKRHPTGELTEHNSRGQTKIPEVEPHTRLETLEERVNRRRQELERRMASKAPGSGKKRRRF